MPARKPVGPQVRLRTYRRAVIGSAEQLAERIAEQGVRVHPDHIRNCELGRQRPSERLLTAWALALGLDPLDVWAPADENRGQAVAAVPPDCPPLTIDAVVERLTTIDRRAREVRGGLKPCASPVEVVDFLFAQPEETT